MRKITWAGAWRRRLLIVIGATLATSAIGLHEAAASTKSYQINGRWYTPHGAGGYDRTGVASYYGPGFHGRKTANGERYDQWGMTAAHPTLPMGTYVYVTNQKNGKTVKVRINDRGPFAGGRIIDLSTHVAEVLGIKSSGIGQVRVRYAGLGAPSDDKRVIAKRKSRDDDDQPKIAAKRKSAPVRVAAKDDDEDMPKAKRAPIRKVGGQPGSSLKSQAIREALEAKRAKLAEQRRKRQAAQADDDDDADDRVKARKVRQLESEAVSKVDKEWRNSRRGGRGS